jgi:hypothetical protein
MPIFQLFAHVNWWNKKILNTILPLLNGGFVSYLWLFEMMVEANNAGSKVVDCYL